MRKLARAKAAKGTLVTRKLLRSWKIPAAKSDDSKEDRGRVFIIGGDREVPGAAWLAGVAAMRAGAGKLQIATCQSAAVHLGIAVPEARVLGLQETKKGSIKGSNWARLADLVNESHATLIGPGMMDEKEMSIFLSKLLPKLNDSTIVLDAGALTPLGRRAGLLSNSRVNAVLTPHSGEMAQLVGAPLEDIEKDPFHFAEDVSRTLGTVVVLKGPETHIVSQDGEYYRYRSGDVGLATSGSGDILGGVITGLAARGASPLQAAVWGVFLHGEAGNALVKKSGRVGYLARELLPEIPPLLDSLSDSSD